MLGNRRSCDQIFEGRYILDAVQLCKCGVFADCLTWLRLALYCASVFQHKTNCNLHETAAYLVIAQVTEIAITMV